MRYAKGTEVGTARSKMEIEQTLSRFGASHFMHGWKDGLAVIEFVAEERRVRFTMKLPIKSDERFQFRTAYGKPRQNNSEQIEKLWEQECRERWRSLALLVKAKLAAVESGITTFEEEFLAHVVGPNGQTIGAWLRPQLQSAYEGGKMPPLLLEGPKES